MYHLKLYHLALIICQLVSTIFADNYVFETKEFRNRSLIPTLSNGHIGFVAYSDAIHLNGVFNGQTGDSHRARIPNFARIQIENCGVFAAGGDDCTYSLDMRQATFNTKLNLGQLAIEHVTYPHRFYDKTIVNHIKLRRNSAGTAAIRMKMLSTSGASSVDLKLIRAQNLEYGPETVTLYHWETLEIEHTKYQSKVRDIFMMTQHVPETVVLPQNMNEMTYSWITTIGYSLDEVKAEFDYALPIRNNLLQTHISEWTNFWVSYGITVEGNDELAKSIHSSLFFLGSSLPSLSTYGEPHPFYGLSPSGLGKGGVHLEEYQGHSFWDTEMWMQPPILLLEPKWSKALIDYRYMTKEAAADIAKQWGQDGLRYSWESGYTGCETTPSCCPQNPEFQQHITAGIAFAVRSHFFATLDTEWFKSIGCELAYETGKFWASRVEYNKEEKLYDIKGVMGPDEDHWNVTNNAYTNVIAAYNLYFAEFASCICHKYYPDKYPVANNWSTIAQSIKLVYDELRDFHPQDDTYELGTVIKQADTVLLGYPLQYPMEDSTKKNNLYIYGNVTREDGPAMTWAMHAIGHLDIGEVPSVDLFQRTYSPYIRKPFYIWNEVVEGQNGVGNFITGAGGFLQLIMNGYAGIRLQTDHIEIKNPKVPPGSRKLSINGFQYLGSTFSLEISEISYIFMIRSRGADKVKIIIDGEEQVADTNKFEVPSGTSFVLMPKDTEFYGDCKLVSSKIGIETDGATSIISKVSLALTFVMSSIVLWLN